MSEFMMKNIRLFVGAVFLLVGLALFGTGTGLHVAFSRFRETALTTTAVITEIVSTRKGDRTTHAAYVEYGVDGKRYNERLPSYTSGMREGQEIAVLYNPDDPSEVDTEAGALFPLIFVGIGLLFAVLGGVFVYLEARKIRRRRRLVAEGQAVAASVVEIYRDDSITMKRGRSRSHPYRVVCEWTNPQSGDVLRFESEELWRHPGELVMVTVYIDRLDPRVYHVAV